MKRKLIPIPCTNRIFLAPMEEVNDPAFRMICKKSGAGLTWTPLSSPLSPVPLILEDKPILQIFGIETTGIKEFMEMYDDQVSGWDFNLGCPATTAKNHGYGAYLQDVKVVEKIVKLMRKNTKKPLSIKIRISPLSYEYLKIAEKYCDAIGIHPRTKAQGYTGEPDIEWAKEFKSKAKIPVIYSGNIDEKNAEEFLKIFDYIMIGRKAIGHPEIFSKITDIPFKKDFKDYLVLAEKYKIQWRLMKFQAMQFTRGEKSSRAKRNRMARALNIEDLKKIFFE